MGGTLADLRRSKEKKKTGPRPAEGRNEKTIHRFVESSHKIIITAPPPCLSRSHLASMFYCPRGYKRRLSCLRKATKFPPAKSTLLSPR